MGTALHEVGGETKDREPCKEAAIGPAGIAAKVHGIRPKGMATPDPS